MSARPYGPRRRIARPALVRASRRTHEGSGAGPGGNADKRRHSATASGSRRCRKAATAPSCGPNGVGPSPAVASQTGVGSLRPSDATRSSGSRSSGRTRMVARPLRSEPVLEVGAVEPDMVGLAETPDPLRFGRRRVLIGALVRSPGDLDERQPPAGEHPGELGHGGGVVGDVLEHVEDHGQVDGTARQGHPAQVGDQPHRPPVGGRGDVHPEVNGVASPEQPGHRRCGSHLEHQPRSPVFLPDGGEQRGEEPVPLQRLARWAARLGTPTRAQGEPTRSGQAGRAEHARSPDQTAEERGEVGGHFGRRVPLGHGPGGPAWCRACQ